jgi:hypothetical protein
MLMYKTYTIAGITRLKIRRAVAAVASQPNHTTEQIAILAECRVRSGKAPGCGEVIISPV